jgi:hypothetical protein
MYVSSIYSVLLAYTFFNFIYNNKIFNQYLLSYCYVNVSFHTTTSKPSLMNFGNYMIKHWTWMYTFFIALTSKVWKGWLNVCMKMVNIVHPDTSRAQHSYISMKRRTLTAQSKFLSDQTNPTLKYQIYIPNCTGYPIWFIENEISSETLNMSSSAY